MATRVNSAVELLAQDQPLYWDGAESGHVLTYEQGKKDAQTWADFINIGMEHGSFDLAGLAEYMRGLGDGGPTNSGHRTPALIVAPPVNGTDELNVQHNAWQFRQLLARGVHGIMLNRVESADAVRAFIESCRYPHHVLGVDPALPTPVERLRGAASKDDGPGRSARANGRPLLGVGTRGRGAERTAAPVWGLTTSEYMERCDPWPLNPRGELLLGIKIESPEGAARCEEILAVPGLGFAELGLGDLGVCLGYLAISRDDLPPEMEEARQRFIANCRRYGLPYSDHATPENIARKIEGGARIISGRRQDTAIAGRRYSKRSSTT